MELTQEYLCEIFEYSEQSPSGLIRKVPVYRGNAENSSIQLKSGTPAGYFRVTNKSTGYGNWYVKVNQKAYTAHRIIWVIFNKEIPEKYVIDHINGNPKDNRVGNLRAVPHSVNCRNSKRSSSNTSGKTGVYLMKQLKKGNWYFYWTAIWLENGKEKHKTFSVKKYGDKLSFEMAVDYRKQQLDRLNELGYSYSNRHGFDFRHPAP